MDTSYVLIPANWNWQMQYPAQITMAQCRASRQGEGLNNLALAGRYVLGVVIAVIRLQIILLLAWHLLLAEHVRHSSNMPIPSMRKCSRLHLLHSQCWRRPGIPHTPLTFSRHLRLYLSTSVHPRVHPSPSCHSLHASQTRPPTPSLGGERGLPTCQRRPTHLCSPQPSPRPGAGGSEPSSAGCPPQRPRLSPRTGCQPAARGKCHTAAGVRDECWVLCRRMQVRLQASAQCC